MSDARIQELDWDDDSLEQQDGIRWFQVSADKPERFAVLSKKVTTARSHYVKGQGYVLCGGDDCPLCAAAKKWEESRTKDQRRKERPPVGKARTRYAVLIAWYNIGSDNKLMASNPVDVGVMAFGGPGKIVQIREIANEWGEGGDPRSVDMKAIISDKSKESFQDFQLQPQKKCLYRENEAVKSALSKKLKMLDFTLAEVIAKDRSNEELQEMVEELFGEDAGAVVSDDLPTEDIDEVLATPKKKRASVKKQEKVAVDELLEDESEEEKIEKIPPKKKAPEPDPELEDSDDEDNMDAFGSILDAL